MKRNLSLKPKLVIAAALLFIGASQLKAETKEVSTYSELLAAVNNVQSGDIIRLTTDISATEADINDNENGIYIANGDGIIKDLTLDLNGHILKGYSYVYNTYSCIYVTGDYNVTITGKEGSKIIGDVSKRSNASAIGIGEKIIRSKTTITLTGDVDIEGYYGIRYGGEGYLDFTSEVTVITDKTYTGSVTGSGYYCVSVAGPKAKFISNGGDFTNTNKNDYTIGATSSGPTVIINGGKFNQGNKGLIITNGSFTITGGTFTPECELKKSFIADGYGLLKDADGNFSVVSENDINVMAYYSCGTSSYTYRNIDETAHYLLTGRTLNITDKTFDVKDFYSFGVPKDVENVTINYTRNYNSHWQAWYMPFDLDVSKYCDKLTFYDITNIAINDNGWVVKAIPVTTLKANTPYLVKSNEVLSNFTITVDNATLKKTTNETKTFSTEYGSTFVFTGTYTKKFTNIETGWYGLAAADGTFFKTNKSG